MPDKKPDRDEQDLPVPLSSSMPSETPPAEPDAEVSPMPPVEPAGSDQTPPAELPGEARDDVPDWLLEYRRKTGMLPPAPPEPPAAEKADAERDELPEWLLEYRRRTGQLPPAAPELPGTEEPGRPRAAASPKSGPPTGEDLPDWLDEYSSSSRDDAIQSPDNALGRLRRAPTGALPDWVRPGETEPPGGKQGSETPAESAQDEGEPAWLQGMPRLPFPVQTIAKPVSGQEPGMPATPGQPHESTDKEPPSGAELPDWLQETPHEEPPAEDALPDWLKESSPKEPSSEAQLPDWLREAPGQATPRPEQPSDAALPDWLQDSSGKEPMAAVPPEAEEAPVPDWLREAVGREELAAAETLSAGPTGHEPEVSPSSSEAAEEPVIPAWLAGEEGEEAAGSSDFIQPDQEEEIDLDELDAKQAAMAYWAGHEAAAAWADEQRAKHAAQMAAKKAAQKPSRRLAPPEQAAPQDETFSELSIEPSAEAPEDAFSEVRRALAEEEQAHPPEKPPTRVKRLTGGLAGLGAAIGLSRRREKPGEQPEEAERPAATQERIPLPSGEPLQPGEDAGMAPTELPAERLAGAFEAGQPPESLELAAFEEITGEQAAPPLEGQPGVPPGEPPAVETETEKKSRLARMVAGALIASRAASGRLRGKPTPPEPEPLTEDEIERRLGLGEALELEWPAQAELAEEDLRSQALGDMDTQTWSGLDADAAMEAPTDEISLEDILGERAEALGEQPEPGETFAAPEWSELEEAAPGEQEEEGTPGFELGFEPEAEPDLLTGLFGPSEVVAPDEQLVTPTTFEEIRAVALEDYVPPTPPPPPSVKARRSLVQVAVVASVMVLVTLCSCCLGLFAFQGQLQAMLIAPPAAATATPLPYPAPVRLVLPGGWPVDLARGGLQDGQWVPQSAEWLGGTEINRWIAIPWGKELEAVFRTINEDDTIVLEMDNQDRLEYTVAFVQEVPRGMIAPLWTNEPSLTIVLSRASPVSPVADPLPETRWMIVAFPKQ